MKGVTWGSDEFTKQIEQAELREKEEYLRSLIESGASREEIEDVIDSFR